MATASPAWQQRTNRSTATADEVILPGTTGQLGILTGHVSMLTALDSGVLRVREGGNWQS
ncbi:hypothetical protein VB757_06330, partial [Synechococcus sp. BA-132 BA5]|nr:hypothetical protein [Synechococcus sp. BA-132 BA5]